MIFSRTSEKYQPNWAKQNVEITFGPGCRYMARITNYAIFNDWSIFALITDSLWGGILFLLTTLIITHLTKLTKITK